MGFRNRVRYLVVVGVGVAAIGCGGGGAGTGGGTTPVTKTQGTANVTAHFHVDVKTGKVTITPLNTAVQPGSRTAPAAFRGNMVGFSSSLLVDEPGDTGRKVLNVSLDNNSGEAIGAVNGNDTGLRVLFSSITNVNNILSIESQTTVSTSAGSTAGLTNGPALAAKFNHANDVAFNPADGSFWVADSNNNVIRRIYDGEVTTVAGSGVAGEVDGFGKNASFDDPYGIAYDPANKNFVVADFLGNKVRRVSLAGNVYTIAGTGAAGSTMGSGSTATITNPTGLAVDNSGLIFLTAQDNIVRELSYTINPDDAGHYNVQLYAGQVTAGFSDGPSAAAKFNSPRGIAVNPLTDDVYVADHSNNAIRYIQPLGAVEGNVATIAGNGTAADLNGLGSSAEFNNPTGIVLDNGVLFVGDSGSNKIRVLGLAPGASATLASNWMVADAAGSGTAGAQNGVGTLATFDAPSMLTSDSSGNLFVADYLNSQIREVQPTSGSFSEGILNGSGTPVSAPVTLGNPNGIIPNSGYGADLPYIEYPGVVNVGQATTTQEWAFVVPNGVNAFEFDVTVEADTTTLAQPGASSGVGSPNVDVRTFAGELNGPEGFVDGGLTEARFGGFVPGMAMDGLGNIYLADQNNDAIRIVTPGGQVATIAGSTGQVGSANGTGLSATFEGPGGVAVTPDGTTIYVADEANDTIRCITTGSPGSTDPTNYTVATIAGMTGNASWTDGSGLTALFANPYSLTMTAGGDVYVLEAASGNRVRRLRFLGGGAAGRLNPADYEVSTVAGSTSGTAGFINGFGLGVEFNNPTGIACDQAGNLYVADSGNEVIRKVTEDGTVTTFAGNGSNGYMDGASTTAEFSEPQDICVDSGGYIYVTDLMNSMIRRISPLGITETVCGAITRGDVDGPGNIARLSAPNGLCISPSGTLYFSDGLNEPSERKPGAKAPTATGHSEANSVRMVQEVVTNNNATG